MKRKLSLLFAAIAFIAVPLWAYLQAEATTRAMVQAHGHGAACGMPILGIYLLAVLVAGVCSALALLFGVLAYRKLSPPRPVMRMLELAVVGMPLLLALVVFIGLAITGG